MDQKQNCALPVTCLNLKHQKRGVYISKDSAGSLEQPNADHYTAVAMELWELSSLRQPISSDCAEALFQHEFQWDGQVPSALAELTSELL